MDAFFNIAAVVPAEEIKDLEPVPVDADTGGSGSTHSCVVA